MNYQAADEGGNKFERESPIPYASPTFPSRSEFADRLKRHMAVSVRFAKIQAATMLTPLVAAGVLTVCLAGTKWLGVGLTAFMVGLVAFFAVSIYWERRRVPMTREMGLACPHCDKPLIGINGKLVLTTSRCGDCGEIVLRAPLN